MKIAKKIFLLALLAAVAAAAVACGEATTGETGGTTDAATKESGEAPDESTGKVDLMTLVPEQNLDGYEIRFFTDQVWDWDFGNMHMEYVEEQNGEPVNDAFYIRNTIIEDRLNMKIAEYARIGNDAPSVLKKMIGSGVDDYDVMIVQSWNIGPLAAEGYFVNLRDMPGLQIDKPWWDSSSIRDYSIKQHLYFMTGDYNLLTDDATWVLYFNKAMTQDLGLNMPYDLVREGKWTFDAMMEYQKAAALDLDGDGAWTAADRWGQVTHTQHYTGILIAGGENLITRDSDGLPVYGQAGERFFDVYGKIIDMMQTPGYTMNIYLNIKGLPSDKHATYNFLDGDALFCPEILAHTRRFRQMESDFGILPHPKYDAAQSQYYSYVLGQATVTCIPVTNKDLPRTSAALDALGMLSAHTIIPAYYEVSYIGKFFRDDESVDMLNVIRGSRVFGIADAYSWNNVTNTYQDAAIKATPITSVFEKNADKVNAAIQKTLESFGIS
ncbi:MAG: extracellular solute-binding protein [Oscillospiraceae bacterium]|nr:extracellular solute-binding protein [Oscillospiraceae bacterium]